jgi:hypothetical protein
MPAGDHVMRRLLVAVALSMGIGSASAQTVGGSYNVKGTNPNGSTYGGTVQITPTGSSCRIVWQTGSTSSSGICMLANKAFAASYLLQGRQGLVVYELQSDGSLKGWWTIAGQAGVGTENLYPK